MRIPSRSLWADIKSSSILRGFRERCLGSGLIGKSPGQAGHYCMCWGEALVWHKGKGSINHSIGHQVCFGRDPRAGLGDHRALHAEDSGWDGDGNHTAPPSQNPAYQMRMVMTRTAARTKKAKIPRDTRTAIFSKGSL